MMTGPLLMAAMWTLRPTLAFLCSPSTTAGARKISHRLFATGASTQLAVESGVSRLSTLQTLLNKHGAPGSQGCNTANDLVAVTMTLQETPELIASLDKQDTLRVSWDKQETLRDLHPYLFPIAKSSSSGNYICAFRSPYVEDGKKNSPPWPIVEAQVGGPGMQLLALNSEHMMRRIASECDFKGDDEDVIEIYNQALGKGFLADSALDNPYEPGSVAKLGYGVDKYVLLRVGPFPDLYETMARQHAERGDEQSSLIAAEASSRKHEGFGSTFLFYSRLYLSFPGREDESRDAARMCLRLPLPTIGTTLEDFKEVAVLAQVADEGDSVEDSVAKLKEMYEKIRRVEREDDYQSGMTPEQMAIDDVNHRLDVAALTGEAWSKVRHEIAEKFRSVGRDDMAAFVDR